MILPKGITLHQIFEFQCQEQINMAGNRQERRFILQNNIRQMKKEFNKLSKQDKQKFIDETMQFAGQDG